MRMHALYTSFHPLIFRTHITVQGEETIYRYVPSSIKQRIAIAIHSASSIRDISFAIYMHYISIHVYAITIKQSLLSANIPFVRSISF